MMKDTQSSLFWLLFAIYISVESYSLGLGKWSMPGTGYFPFVAGVLLGMISLSLLIRTLLKTSLKKILSNRSKDLEPLNWKNLILTLAGMLVYVFFLHWLGFALDTFLLMIFLIWAVGRRSWFVSITSALSITVASYLLFERALDCQLPKGILEAFL